MLVTSTGRTLYLCKDNSDNSFDRFKARPVPLMLFQKDFDISVEAKHLLITLMIYDIYARYVTAYEIIAACGISYRTFARGIEELHAKKIVVWDVIENGASGFQRIFHLTHPMCWNIDKLDRYRGESAHLVPVLKLNPFKWTPRIFREGHAGIDESRDAVYGMLHVLAPTILIHADVPWIARMVWLFIANRSVLEAMFKWQEHERDLENFTIDENTAPDNPCQLKLAEISSALDISERTVSRHIEALKDRGMLSYTRSVGPSGGVERKYAVAKTEAWQVTAPRFMPKR